MTEEKQEWSYSLPDDGKVFPENLIGAVWSYVKWFRLDPSRPSSEEQLANLIYPAFQASLSSEEGRAVRLQVVFDIAPTRFTVRFTEPLPYTAGQLVKLAPTIGIGSRWLVTQPDETSQNSVRIAGILDPDILPVERVHQRWGHGLTVSQGFPLPTRPPWFKISIFGPGWIRASTVSTSFELRNCCYREPLIVGRIRHVIDWCREIPSRLGIQVTGAYNLGAALARSFLVNVLAKISDARHGGSLLIIPDNADLSSIPLKIKYRMDSDMVQVVIRERASVEPIICLQGPEIPRDDPTVAKSLWLDRDLAQVTDFVAGLAAVDGAVVLQRDLKLVGFGAEITIAGMPSSDEKVEYGNPPLGKPSAISLADFGMRHRSAIRFCQAEPGVMAFVVSQDGGIRLFESIDGSVRLWDELSAEE
jgi:Probable sensor domain DACNV